MYNEKKQFVMRKIRQYLLDNPQDIHAEKQLEFLSDLPDIGRGGLLGNDNLNHWGVLYGE